MKATIIIICLAFGSVFAGEPPFPGTNKPPVIKPSVPGKIHTKSLVSSGPSYVMTISHVLDVDFFGCGEFPGCEKYDYTHLEIAHAPDVNTILEATSVVTSTEWVQIGIMPPGIDEIAWFEPKTQRHPEWFFRVRDVPIGTMSPAARSSKPKIVVNGLMMTKHTTSFTKPSRRPKTILYP